MLPSTPLGCAGRSATRGATAIHRRQLYCHSQTSSSNSSAIHRRSATRGAAHTLPQRTIERCAEGLSLRAVSYSGVSSIRYVGSALWLHASCRFFDTVHGRGQRDRVSVCVFSSLFLFVRFSWGCFREMLTQIGFRVSSLHLRLWSPSWCFAFDLRATQIERSVRNLEGFLLTNCIEVVHCERCLGERNSFSDLIRTSPDDR